MIDVTSLFFGDSCFVADEIRNGPLEKTEPFGRHRE